MTNLPKDDPPHVHLDRAVGVLVGLAGIAEVMFGVPEEIAERTRSYLTRDVAAVVDAFEAATGGRGGSRPAPA